MQNIFSRSLVTKENLDKLSVYFSIFERTKKAIWHLAIWQNCCLGQFIIQKLKSKRLVCLSFLLEEFFEGTIGFFFYIFRTL